MHASTFPLVRQCDQYRFLKRVAAETEAAVVMISGNHDSGDRIEAMSVFFTALRVLVRGIRRRGRNSACTT